MHGNHHPHYDHSRPPAQTVIVRQKGGGCLRATLVGAAVLAGLVVLGGLLAGGGRTGGNLADPAGPTVAEAATPTKRKSQPRRAVLGDTVKDGKFSFKVTRVQKGVERVGDEYLGSDAQGQYVLVHVTVKNIGDESQLFSGSSQKLIDARGRQYDTDSGAAALALKNSNAFLNTINPGNTVNGILLFDVPENFSIKAIELHDSIFSDGVTVALDG
ncbi:DUF4352 domain-containing protein [Streptosporangium sp. NPDC023615]|uniref:DUF4352 domain-containing protein n=1 Tax=Streptosporangium sp. NPDC023615 TaxID=3154794 RepID=UPI00341B975A